MEDGLITQRGQRFRTTEAGLATIATIATIATTATIAIIEPERKEEDETAPKKETKTSKEKYVVPSPLPDDLVSMVCRYFDIGGLGKFATVSKRYSRQLASKSSELLWRNAVLASSWGTRLKDRALTAEPTQGWRAFAETAMSDLPSFEKAFRVIHKLYMMV